MKNNINPTYNNKITNITPVKTISYFEAVARALIVYATKDKCYENYLFDKVKDLRGIKKFVDNKVILTDIKLLMPLDYYSATEKTDWLLKSINVEEKAGLEIISIFKSHVREEAVNPRSLVIGIVGLALPSPTLGVISTKKRKRMSLIVESSFKNKSKIKFADIAIKVSHELFKKELKKSNQKLDKLDPDVSGWFFEEKEMVFYETDTGQVKSIINELSGLSVNYVEYKENEKTGILAISPAINDGYQEILWSLKKIT